MRPVTLIILAWIMFLLVCCLVLVSNAEAKRREMDRYKNMLQDIKRKISENTEREE